MSSTRGAVVMINTDIVTCIGGTGGKRRKVNKKKWMTQLSPPANQSTYPTYPPVGVLPTKLQAPPSASTGTGLPPSSQHYLTELPVPVERRRAAG